MLKRINNKGFTLIELLATIAILAIVSSITIVTVVDYVKKSKEKTEQAFYKQLENHIENYISLYGTKLEYNVIGENKIKCHTEAIGVEEGAGTEICSEVKLFQAINSPTIETITDTVSNKIFINPSTEVVCANDNTRLTIFRDNDFVYCFTLEIEEGQNSCISKEEFEINTCNKIYKNS